MSSALETRRLNENTVEEQHGLHLTKHPPGVRIPARGHDQFWMVETAQLNVAGPATNIIGHHEWPAGDTTSASRDTTDEITFFGPLNTTNQSFTDTKNGPHSRREFSGRTGTTDVHSATRCIRSFQQV